LVGPESHKCAAYSPVDAPRFAYRDDNWYSLEAATERVMQHSDGTAGQNQQIDEAFATTPGEVMMRQMRETCSKANWNSTSCMGFLLMAL